MDPGDEPVNIDSTSPAVQTHLEIIQGVIERMASSSASCKTWCITIVAAILVVVADKDKPTLVWLAVLPTVLFASLDIYYLALERGFRQSYNAFVRKLHAKTLTSSDLYSLNPTGAFRELLLGALMSFSIAGFYGPVICLALLTLALTST